MIYGIFLEVYNITLHGGISKKNLNFDWSEIINIISGNLKTQQTTTKQNRVNLKR
jgi:hypothetical protein